jgi:hypothetical protein
VLLQAEGKAQCALQGGRIELVLGEVVAGAALHSLYRHPLIAVSGKKDYRHVQAAPAHLAQQVQPRVHPQLIVQEEHVVAAVWQLLQCRCQGIGMGQVDGDVGQGADEQVTEQSNVILAVVHKKNAHQLLGGRGTGVGRRASRVGRKRRGDVGRAHRPTLTCAVLVLVAVPPLTKGTPFPSANISQIARSEHGSLALALP